MLAQVLHVGFYAQVEGGVQVVCHVHHAAGAQTDVHFDVGVAVLLLVQLLDGVAPVEPYLVRIIVHQRPHICGIA